MPTQKQNKKLTRKQYEARIALLEDRAALMLVLLKNRHGDDWNPWAGEAMWEDADSMTEILRGWPQYRVALDVIRLWTIRNDKRIEGEG